MHLSIDPEALIAATSKIGRDWGHTGYRIIDVGSPLHQGSVLLTVRASDGGVFFVGATRYGNTVWADEVGQAMAALSDQLIKDSQP
jgi:hypothetical protein